MTAFCLVVYVRSLGIKLKIKQPVNYPYYRLLQTVNAYLHTLMTLHDILVLIQTI